MPNSVKVKPNFHPILTDLSSNQICEAAVKGENIKIMVAKHLVAFNLFVCGPAMLKLLDVKWEAIKKTN